MLYDINLSEIIFKMPLICTVLIQHQEHIDVTACEIYLNIINHMSYKIDTCNYVKAIKSGPAIIEYFKILMSVLRDGQNNWNLFYLIQRLV